MGAHHPLLTTRLYRAVARKYQVVKLELQAAQLSFKSEVWKHFAFPVLNFNVIPTLLKWEWNNQLCIIFIMNIFGKYVVY